MAGTRTYACIDPQCNVVIERASEEWSSSVDLMINQGFTRVKQRLDPTMMLNIMATLCYAYQGQTGEWPQLVKDRKMIVLDANEDDKLYLQRCKTELDKKDGLLAAPVVTEPAVTRVRVRPAPPTSPVAPVSPPEFRVRTRS